MRDGERVPREPAFPFNTVPLLPCAEPDSERAASFRTVWSRQDGTPMAVLEQRTEMPPHQHATWVGLCKCASKGSGETISCALSGAFSAL